MMDIPLGIDIFEMSRSSRSLRKQATLSSAQEKDM
jgi:hypothetical protein